MTRGTIAYLIVAALALAASFVLGASVSHAAPSQFDLSELGQYGNATPVARFFTSVGRFPTYFVLCVALVVFAAFRRSWIPRVAIAIAGLIALWQTSDLMKLFFHRLRPLHPIVPEQSFSFPSGHADLSMFFYGLWAYFIATGDAPLWIRRVVPGLLVLLAATIGWSRLALGAHFPTDVLGGYLFGAGFFALVVALTKARTRRTTTN